MTVSKLDTTLIPSKVLQNYFLLCQKNFQFHLWKCIGFLKFNTYFIAKIFTIVLSHVHNATQVADFNYRQKQLRWELHYDVNTSIWIYVTMKLCNVNYLASLVKYICNPSKGFCAMIELFVELPYSGHIAKLIIKALRLLKNVFLT